MRELLVDRRFRLLFAGLVLSMIGDSMLLIVLLIWVKSLTGSSGLAGLTALFMTAPSLLAPLGGFLIDRVRRRPFLVAANVLTGLALLPLLLVSDRDGLPVIWAVASAYGLSIILTGAALNGLLKALVGEELLAPANGAIQTVREGLRLGGPLAGAGIYAAAGAGPVVAIDIATFAGAAIAIALLRVHEERPSRAARAGIALRDEVTAGLRHVRRTPVQWVLFTTFAAAITVIGFTESAIFAVVDAIGRSPSFVGVFGAFQGAGAIAGGIAAPLLIRRLGELRTAATGLALFGIGSGLTMTLALGGVLAGAVVAGAGLPLLIVAYYTVLQRTTPQALMGRVSTAGEVVIGVPQTASIGVGALLVGIADVRLIFGAIVTVMALCALRLFTTRVAMPVAAGPAGPRS